jgi:glucokinase
MTDLVTVDIGGTHARFARAQVAADGGIELGEVRVLKTDDYVGLQTAWDAYRKLEHGKLPRAASIAIAGPVGGQTIRMTNNSWSFRPADLPSQIDVDEISVINDFGAVAHAVASTPDAELIHICGPEGPLPPRGTISVIGPGTGLGVAHFHRFDGGYHVQSTEGGHIDFAPIDAIDDAMMLRLRKRHRPMRSAPWRNSTTAPYGSAACRAKITSPPPRWSDSASRWAAWQAIMRWPMGRAV